LTETFIINSFWIFSVVQFERHNIIWYRTSLGNFTSTENVYKLQTLKTAHSKQNILCNIILNNVRQYNYFVTQGNYIGYMFRLLVSHLQAYFFNWVARCFAHIGIPSCLHSWKYIKVKSFVSKVWRANCVYISWIYKIGSLFSKKCYFFKLCNKRLKCVKFLKTVY